MNDYPSVTQIIRPHIDTEWFKPEHAARGTAVHAAASAHLLNVWSPPLPPEYQGYFDSFRRWSDIMIDKILLVETRLYDHKLGFSGKPDLIAILKGDEHPAMADWKTSQAVAKWWPLQDAGYRHLAAKDRGIVCHRGLTVRLKADGSGCLVTEHPRDYRPALNIFLGELNTFKFFKAA